MEGAVIVKHCAVNSNCGTVFAIDINIEATSARNRTDSMQRTILFLLYRA